MENANFSSATSVDPDQIPRFAASDLGLYCLPMSLSGHEWVKKFARRNILRANLSVR